MKNTTKWDLVDLICPHTCRGCGELGAVLCERCKKYILDEHVEICPICKKIVAETKESVQKVRIVDLEAESKFCEGCDSPFEMCWVVGWREGALAKVVKDFKYKSVRAAGGVLAELVDMVLPRDFSDMTVVPLPTIGRHVRERGLDHTKILAKKLAKMRNWRVDMALARATDAVQVGTNAVKRKSQADSTYDVVKKLDPEGRYLLIDDIWTTGATMQAAAKKMREAGAKKIYGVVLAIGRPGE